MCNLVVQQSNLPDTIEDLSKFVLVGREKLTAVRAEIRAINKVQLAQEVREQKREEAQMLAEALLDAEVKIGDLLKTIPKAQGARTDIKKPIDTSVVKLETKKDTIERLGFNKKQAERFETLSSNKEIVEQVKAEARENEDIPTRSRVLQLVKEKSKQERYIEQEFKKIENKKAIELNYHNALFKILTLDIKEEEVQIWIEGMMQEEKETLENDLNEAIRKFQQMKEIIKNKNKIRRIK